MPVAELIHVPALALSNFVREQYAMHTNTTLLLVSTLLLASCFPAFFGFCIYEGQHLAR